jgi:hypothetical protein
MRRRLSFFLLCLFCPSVFMESLFSQAVSKPDIHGLDKRIFIGQAYPSGNVYLECFRRKADCQSSWPKEVSIFPLDDLTAALGKIQTKASFVKVMKDDLKDDTTHSIYIPGAEGMDGDHDSCGLGKIKREGQYRYVSEQARDYFNAMSDHCEANEGVGIYRFAASKYSFLVLAIDPEIAVAGLKLLSGKRPLSPADRQVIAKVKRKLEKAAVECPTNPAYIDSAIQIAEITLAEGDLRLRLSAYEDPGCHGHLASIYILDVLHRDLVLRKFEIHRNQGLL